MNASSLCRVSSKVLRQGGAGLRNLVLRQHYFDMYLSSKACYKFVVRPSELCTRMYPFVIYFYHDVNAQCRFAKLWIVMWAKNWGKIVQGNSLIFFLIYRASLCSGNSWNLCFKSIGFESVLICKLSRLVFWWFYSGCPDGCRDGVSEQTTFAFFQILTYSLCVFIFTLY